MMGCESAHSKKTRIETCKTILHQSKVDKVKAPIPRKQGLKLLPKSKNNFTDIWVKAPIPRKQGLKRHWFDLIEPSKRSESAHSKKTRIETKRLCDNKIRKSCESAHSKKTRIETFEKHVIEDSALRYVKAPIPRKQGLKPQLNRASETRSNHVKAPIPRKQGLKHQYKRPYAEFQLQ